MTISPPSGHAEQLAAFLQDIADKNCEKKLAGIALGVIFEGQEISACGGWADIESKQSVSTATVFEVGSISKLFTSLLLAVAATRGEIALDDPVQTALGEQVTLPTDGKSQITYRSLANHRSSLPRLPDDLLKTANMENPYVHYDQSMLYACLHRMKSVSPIGSRASYSNFGVGLLGHVLGRLAGSDYRTALRERVLVPLGMLNTSTGSSEEPSAPLATAYKKKGQPTKHWDFTEVTVAAGGVRSSLSEMFKFLRANLDPAATELASELMLMREPSQLPYAESRRDKFLGWSLPLLYVVALAIFCFCLSGVPWLTQVGSDGLLHFSIMLLPTLAAAVFGGRVAGTVTLIAMTGLTWWLWGVAFASFSELVWGAILIYVFSRWKPSQYVDLLRGEGRLAWQSSQVGTQAMLWHNGMVGGSASFLGIVPELGLGVVVLTNTAKSVDALGVRILSELVERKEPS